METIDEGTATLAVIQNLVGETPARIEQFRSGIVHVTDRLAAVVKSPGDVYAKTRFFFTYSGVTKDHRPDRSVDILLDMSFVEMLAAITDDYYEDLSEFLNPRVIQGWKHYTGSLEAPIPLVPGPKWEGTNGMVQLDFAAFVEANFNEVMDAHWKQIRDKNKFPKASKFMKTRV